MKWEVTEEVVEEELYSQSGEFGQISEYTVKVEDEILDDNR